MKVIARLFAVVTSGVVLASIAGAIGAFRARERIVPIDEPDADEVRLTAIFAPLHFRSTATSFRGGTLDCWYGGGVVDLREAVLDPAGAHLDVRAVFGGGQIVVPESWRVTTNVVGLGGIGDGRSKVQRSAAAPELVVEGFVAFGGFGVTSELSEAQLHGLDEAVEGYRRRRGATMDQPV